MDTGFETIHRAWAARAATASGQAGDWAGLRARLAAAHSARRVLLAASAPAAPAKGSFAPAAAESLAALGEVLASVNRNDLGDGKPARGMGDTSPALHSPATEE
ncbi:MAG: hypothetical protein ACREBO_13615 [Novosphingobium sp.]